MPLKTVTFTHREFTLDPDPASIETNAWLDHLEEFKFVYNIREVTNMKGDKKKGSG